MVASLLDPTTFTINEDGTLTILDVATEVGKYGFYKCADFNSIAFPNTVNIIDDYAFACCNNLTSVTLSDSVTRIGEGAFYYCRNLQSVTIPDSVVKIDRGAFSNCSNLVIRCAKASTAHNYAKLNNIPYLLTSADNLAIDIDEAGTLYISGEGAMPNYHYTSSETAPWYSQKDKIKSIIIENGITSIGDDAFYNCINLTSIQLPDSITYVGDSAFYGCRNLVSVDIPNNVNYLGSNVFRYCNSLTSISIPSTIETIKDGSFYDCISLTNISISSSVSSSITSIGSYAFYNCISLSDISIFNQVTKIESYALDLTGWYIDQPDGLLIVGSVVYKYKGTMQDNTTIDIPTTATSIAAYAFAGCIGLTSISIPESVTSIGTKAFANCIHLEKILLLNSITTIEEDAFENCTNLTIQCYENSIAHEYAKSNDISYTLILYLDLSLNEIVTWHIYNDILYILGQGKIPRYEDDLLVPWNSQKHKIATVHIDAGIHTIGQSAFEDFNNLTNIMLSEGLQTIDTHAFRNCSKLTYVTIPSTVKDIGSDAFEGCYSLKRVNISSISSWCTIKFNNINSNPLNYAHSLYINGEIIEDVEIPENILEIQPYAFSGCTSLRDVELLNISKGISEYAFSGCTSLLYIVAVKDPNVISVSAFNQCPNLTIKCFENSKIDIYAEENSIKTEYFNTCGNALYWYIYNNTLNIFGPGTTIYDYSDSSTAPWYNQQSSILQIHMWGNIKTIGKYAFYMCESVSDVILPNSLETIKDSAFKGCGSLTSIHLFNMVNSIGSNVFFGCNNLISISVEDSNETYSSTDGVLYNSDTTILLQCPRGRDTHYTIPDTCKEISDWAFSYCTKLPSVYIPESVTSIGADTFTGCGSDFTIVCYENSFAETYAASKTIKCKIVHHANDLSWYIDNNILTIFGDGYMDDYSNEEVAPWYSERANITSVYIEDGVKSIGDNAFYEFTKLSHISIPESVNTIGASAFYQCKNINEVTLPNTISVINDSTFYNCINLQYINIPIDLTKIDQYAFEGCERLLDITILDTVTQIDKSAFDGCEELTIHCPKDSIAQEYAENNSINYELLDHIDDGLSWYVYAGMLRVSGQDSIPDYDYHWQSKKAPWYPYRKDIQNISLSNTISSIGEFAFSGCFNAVDISIPDAVVNIGSGGFENCNNVKYIKLPNMLTNLGSGTFYNCHNLASIAIPNKITRIEDGSFYNCTNLKYVLIPDTVSSIGECAFYGCNNLTVLPILDSVTSIQSNAFSGCSNLIIRCSKGSIAHKYAISNNIPYQLFNYFDEITWVIDTDVLTVSGNGTNVDMKDYSESNLPPWDSQKHYIREVYITDQIASIGAYAFYNCSSLLSITIPKNVTRINSNAFYGCDKLTIKCTADSAAHQYALSNYIPYELYTNI